MKKSIIKRRKRVVPALQDQRPHTPPSPPLAPSLSPDSAQPYHHELVDDQRGSINPDGSINLGSRQRESTSNFHTPYQQNPHHHPPPVDFTGYHISPSHSKEDHNQPLNGAPVPPMTYPSPSQHHTSLSPHLPTSKRKRSFSATQEGPSTALDSPDTNRLGSISSILNPTQHQENEQQRQGFSASAEDMPIEPSLLAMSTAPPPIPDGTLGLSTLNGSGVEEKEKMERRAQLRVEAEAMREMLRAKERELAELGVEG